MSRADGVTPLIEYKAVLEIISDLLAQGKIASEVPEASVLSYTVSQQPNTKVLYFREQS